ncbi:hypothetical protein KI387_020527, partial [Taxus chinensis]
IKKVSADGKGSLNMVLHFSWWILLGRAMFDIEEAREIEDMFLTSLETHDEKSKGAAQMEATFEDLLQIKGMRARLCVNSDASATYTL